MVTRLPVGKWNDPLERATAQWSPVAEVDRAMKAVFGRLALGVWPGRTPEFWKEEREE